MKKTKIDILRGEVASLRELLAAVSECGDCSILEEKGSDPACELCPIWKAQEYLKGEETR